MVEEFYKVQYNAVYETRMTKYALDVLSNNEWVLY